MLPTEDGLVAKMKARIAETDTRKLTLAQLHLELLIAMNNGRLLLLLNIRTQRATNNHKEQAVPPSNPNSSISK
jgi:hypothetical protein